MSWIEVDKYAHPGGWANAAMKDALTLEYCHHLERGAILFFSRPPFEFPDEDRLFLLGQRQSGTRAHKNISYRPTTKELRGSAGETPEDNARLQRIMHNYSMEVKNFVDAFLMPYAKFRMLDFASYRPIEEKNRDLPVHKRNDLLHIDAFPTRPTNGGRILRVFTNINPTENRVWETTDTFDVVVARFAEAAGLRQVTANSALRQAQKLLSPLLKVVGLKGTGRSAYDRFMLHFHDWLKESGDFQTNYPKVRTNFPPNSVWLVFTDAVPHAVLAGTFAIEQTFIVPVRAMVSPASAPIRVLENLVGRQLSN